MVGTQEVADSAASSVLIIVVTGFRKDESQWEALGSALFEAGVFSNYATATWRIFDHRLGTYSRSSLDTKARELEAWIAEQWEEGGFTDVILVGHSAGGAMVRQAWLNAVDPSQADFTNGEWGRRVTRFVLFAGVSRGVDMEATVSRKLTARLFELIPGRFATEDCIRGSAFLTNLRISWMRFMEALPLTNRPVIAQVLGTKDDLVSLKDSLDVTVFPTVLRRNISDADHADLYHLQGRNDAESRLRHFIAAFTDQPSVTEDPPEAEVSSIVMIVHGIRASRSDDWVKRAKSRVETLWPHVRAVSPTYGYLSALRFALPNVRRRHSRYFRDFYTELVAKHPRGRISVLCHSNGTYLLGRSLKDFESIRLERVALAGSVLPADYGWDELVEHARVKGVRSDGGAFDFPVAVLCNALRGLGMNDVGTGGYDGFRSDHVADIRFHRGGHGSMLDDANLDSMLGFLIEGSRAAPNLNASKAPLRWLSRLMRYAAPGLVLGLLAFLAYAIWNGLWPFVIASLVVLAFLYILLDII